MPGLAYDPTSVNDQLTRITSQSNPLMTQAQSRGERSAGRRGLLNSSIAGQAGQAAVLDVALPMAAQEAQQRYGTSEREATQRFTTRERLGTQKFNERLEKGRIASTERIASMNLDAQRQQAAAQFAAQMEAQYTGLFQSLMSNPNLSGNDRNAYMEHFGRMRDSNYGLIEQMYNIDLDWENPSFTENAPPANTNTNQPSGNNTNTTSGSGTTNTNTLNPGQPLPVNPGGSPTRGAANGNSGGDGNTPGGVNGVEQNRPDPYSGRDRTNFGH